MSVVSVAAKRKCAFSMHCLFWHRQCMLHALSSVTVPLFILQIQHFCIALLRKQASWNGSSCWVASYSSSGYCCHCWALHLTCEIPLLLRHSVLPTLYPHGVLGCQVNFGVDILHMNQATPVVYRCSLVLAGCGRTTSDAFLVAQLKNLPVPSPPCHGHQQHPSTTIMCGRNECVGQTDKCVSTVISLAVEGGNFFFS